jgi:hypothetical protein
VNYIAAPYTRMNRSRLSVIVRQTREEAVRAGQRIVQGMKPDRPEPQAERHFVHGSDSVMIRDGYRLAEPE